MAGFCFLAGDYFLNSADQAAGGKRMAETVPKLGKGLNNIMI